MMISKRARRLHQGFRHGGLRRRQPANSKADAVIEVASINTREPQRDTHLQGAADFFDAENSRSSSSAGKEVSKQDGDWKLRAISPFMA